MAVVLLARQRIREARELIRHNRAAALIELEEAFQNGNTPEMLLDGRYASQVILTTCRPAVDALIRFAATSWQGSSFDSETGTGEAMLAKGAKQLLKMFFLRYHSVTEDALNGCRAFSFNTYIGASLHYPDQQVLVTDYCDEHNPRLLRRIVNEVVEIGEDYYLGRMLIQQYPCRWICRAYFTLSTLPDTIAFPWLEQAA